MVRGESITSAMQSFLNAGYTPQEVELAAKKINMEGAVTTNPPQVTPTQQPSANKLPTSKIKVATNHKYRGLIISLLAVLGIIVVALILLYIFQEQVF
ncbi:hypothetical protein HN747_01040 [archaeon]|jgi:hypothetical protein|nr:hypothetical protein [archaeon]